MVIFLLKDKAMINLEGRQSCIYHRIEHQTEKAILLAVLHTINGEEKSRAMYWFPKSQILIDDQVPIGFIDPKIAKKIEIDDWKWQDRKLVS